MNRLERIIALHQTARARYRQIAGGVYVSLGTLTHTPARCHHTLEPGDIRAVRWKIANLKRAVLRTETATRYKAGIGKNYGESPTHMF